MNNQSDLMTVYGPTDNTITTGTVPLTSDLLQASVNLITIPRGMAMKIWAVRISGLIATTFTIGFAKLASGVGSAAVHNAFYFDPAAATVLPNNLRHPIVIPSLIGTVGGATPGPGETVVVKWSQVTKGLAYFEMDFEFIPL